MSEVMNRATGVKTLDHVTLVVGDLERSRRFYVNVLGMEEVDRPAFSFPGAWFEADGRQIHLILEHAESGPAGMSVDEQTTATRTHHFAFEIEDAEKALEILDAAGVKVLVRSKKRPDGAIQIFVEDPDGHIVELCQKAV